MVAYVVLANFTEQGIRNAKESPKRAEAFKAMAKTFGVTVREIVWTQGRYDIVTILDAPDESSFMSLTLSLAALGNVRTESLRAFSAAEMTKGRRQHAYLTTAFVGWRLRASGPTSRGACEDRLASPAPAPPPARRCRGGKSRPAI